MASNYIRFDWAMKRLLRNKANFAVLEGFLTTFSSKKKNPSLLYSYVTYLYLINYTYSPYIFPQNA